MASAQLTLEKVPQAVSQIQDQLDQLLRAVLSNNQATKFAMPGTPITTKELCKFLNISPVTCIRWRKKGKIPFLKIGGSIRYDKAAVVAAIENKRGGKAA